MQPPALERVTLDSSALLGAQRRYLVAAAALGYSTASYTNCEDLATRDSDGVMVQRRWR